MIILDKQVSSEELEIDSLMGVEMDAVRMGYIGSDKGETESAGRNGKGFIIGRRLKVPNNDMTTHLSPHPFLPCLLC